MERLFVLIPEEKMQENDIPAHATQQQIARALGCDKDVLHFDDLSQFEYIDKFSTSVPHNPHEKGTVVGWDVQSGEFLGTFYGTFDNYIPIHFLSEYGQSIDAPPLKSENLSKDQIEVIRLSIIKLLDEIQPNGKPISQFNHDEFLKYSQNELNYKGETSSPLFILSVGKEFFMEKCEGQQRVDQIVGVFNYLAKEFPEQIISHDQPNREQGRSTLLERIKEIAAKAPEGSTLRDTVDKLQSRQSHSKTQTLK